MERRRSNQINKLSTEELHGKSKQDIIDELKRKYDSNNDGIFQDEEVDEMLLDTIELCQMKDNLEVEKSMMLNKVRSPLPRYSNLIYHISKSLYHSLHLLHIIAVEEDEPSNEVHVSSM